MDKQFLQRRIVFILSSVVYCIFKENQWRPFLYIIKFAFLCVHEEEIKFNEIEQMFTIAILISRYPPLNKQYYKKERR